MRGVAGVRSSKKSEWECVMANLGRCYHKINILVRVYWDRRTVPKREPRDTQGVGLVSKRG
jgi:hypothetical protein